jgi:hypothetical protein
MKRPDIESLRTRLLDDATPGTTCDCPSCVSLNLCDYALYLERRLNDVMLGCEVDDIPHKYGEPL